jgi:CubicO group peptidase (beta-lactamase class C family)
VLTSCTTSLIGSNSPGTLQAPAWTAQTPPDGTFPVSTSTDSEITARLDAYFTSLGFSGAVLIAQDGRVLLSRGYGKANRLSGVPNTAQTKFRIASITKQFTAMGILILQAQHKLNFQDSICNYIDSCPNAWKAITLHHLLTHTSGIPDYYRFTDWIDYQATPMAPSELLAHFKDKPLEFQPGQNWSYSNSGYVVLGNILEKVSGVSYEAFIKENILIPLNMNATGYLGSPDDLAIGYPNASTNSPAEFEDITGLYASGGLYSTVGDLYLWDQSFLTDKLLLKDLCESMFKSYAPVSLGGFSGYGYGWFTGEIEGRRAIGHTGRVEGFISSNIFFPEEKTAVIVLSNQWDTYIGTYLYSIIFNR